MLLRKYGTDEPTYRRWYSFCDIADQRRSILTSHPRGTDGGVQTYNQSNVQISLVCPSWLSAPEKTSGIGHVYILACYVSDSAMPVEIGTCIPFTLVDIRADLDVVAWQ